MKSETNGYGCVEKRGFSSEDIQGAVEPAHGAVRIARATKADVPEILGCIRGLAEYEHLPVTATEASLLESLFGAQPAADVLLAFCQSDCAGFALYFSTFCSALGRRGLFLDNLFVKKEYRGRGVGHALFTRLASIARERKCARLEWSVLNWNQPAISFYQGEGAALLHGWTRCRLTEEAMHRLCGEDHAPEDTGFQQSLFTNLEVIGNSYGTERI